MSEDLEARIKKIIVEQLNVNEEQVTPEASFTDDLGADSLGLVELIMALEDEFEDEVGEEIPESDSEKLTTVGHAIAYIKDPKGFIESFSAGDSGDEGGDASESASEESKDEADS